VILLISTSLCQEHFLIGGFMKIVGFVNLEMIESLPHFQRPFLRSRGYRVLEVCVETLNMSLALEFPDKLR
jgi:hypothetical protein